MNSIWLAVVPNTNWLNTCLVVSQPQRRPDEDAKAVALRFGLLNYMGGATGLQQWELALVLRW